MQEYERPFYRETKYKPLICYIVFGAGGGEPLQVSRKRHKASGVPAGLHMRLLDGPTYETYIGSLLSGAMETFLSRHSPDLYTRVKSMDRCMLLQGTVERDDTLLYLRDVIGILQALAEQTPSAVIFDLQALALYSAEEWRDTFFTPPLSPLLHAPILVSTAEDGSGLFWLHTRGMRKFGRPDFSFYGVPEQDCPAAGEIIDQLILSCAMGALFGKPLRMSLKNGRHCEFALPLVEDFDSPDFNNMYYELPWPDITFTG